MPGTPTEPTKPVEPMEPEMPTEPGQPEKDMTPINLGNSGLQFSTLEEAEAYGDKTTHDESSEYYGWGYENYPLFNKENEPLGTFTVNFYQ